jgi:hypothetical protein
MVNNDDKACLVDLCIEEVKKFKLVYDDIFNIERIIYGDYTQGIDGDGRPYVQVNDIKDMIEKIKDYLDDHN